MAYDKQTTMAYDKQINGYDKVKRRNASKTFTISKFIRAAKNRHKNFLCRKGFEQKLVW